MLSVLALFLSVLAIARSACPNDTHYDSNYNKCYKYVSQATTFLSAEEYCTSIGGHLVTVQSGFENSYVAGMARGSDNPWIGLNYLMANYWTWVDSQNSSYINWAPGQPQDPSMYQCASIGTVNNMWTKELCNSYHPFVCTVDPSFVPVTSTPSPMLQNCSAGCSSNHACSAGYSLFPGTCKCYKFDDTLRNFASSQSFCQSEGGMIVTIESADLNDFLLTIIGDPNHQPWIGVQCSSVNQTCFWQDGAPLVGYSNWDGESNPFLPIAYMEDIISYKQGKWAGYSDFTAGTSVLCQKPSSQVSVLLEEMQKEQSRSAQTSFEFRRP